MTVATPSVPVAAPIEPTTPIKPSEAIRLGCLLAPVQAFGEYRTLDGAACALGTMALGYGWDGDLGSVLLLEFLMRHGIPGSLHKQIASLNDRGQWPREQIADWLAEQGL